MVLHVVMYKPKPETTDEEIETAKETVEIPTPHVMHAFPLCNLPDVSVQRLQGRAGAEEPVEYQVTALGVNY